MLKQWVVFYNSTGYRTFIWLSLYDFLVVIINVIGYYGNIEITSTNPNWVIVVLFTSCCQIYDK